MENKIKTIELTDEELSWTTQSLFCIRVNFIGNSAPLDIFTIFTEKDIRPYYISGLRTDRVKEKISGGDVMFELGDVRGMQVIKDSLEESKHHIATRNISYISLTRIYNTQQLKRLKVHTTREQRSLIKQVLSKLNKEDGK